MSRTGQYALLCEMRRVLNEAGARGDVVGDEALGAMLHLVSEKIAGTKEPLRTHLVSMVTDLLPSFVRYEAGDDSALVPLEREMN
jgi:hypothetical protein